MSSRAALERRFARLRDIGAILDAMKSFALVETHRLARLVANQQAALQALEAVARDFASFHPVAPPPSANGRVIVAVGSQRGFCGGFDQRVRAALEARAGVRSGIDRVVVVGRRLADRLDPARPPAAVVEGALGADEIPAVVDRLLEVLPESAGGPRPVCVLAWSGEGSPQLRPLLPPAGARPSAHPFPPRLNLAPGRFLDGLLAELLPLRLEASLAASLLAENQERLRHMQGALDRLDERLARLRVSRAALRKARIVEEIELLLTSVGALPQGSAGRGARSRPPAGDPAGPLARPPARPTAPPGRADRGIAPVDGGPDPS